ncbi:unnamed protein product [Ectocarpus fasciculatus]
MLGENQLTGGVNKHVVDFFVAVLLCAGSIPKELGDLCELEELWLSVNQLSGSITKELGALSQLRELNLYDNKLTGPIPKELGALTKLTSLFLRSNKLTGEKCAQSNVCVVLILKTEMGNLFLPHPAELGKLSALQHLELHNNQLNGPIPPELGKLSALQELYLSKNQLTGESVGFPPIRGRVNPADEEHRESCVACAGNAPKELGALRKQDIQLIANNQVSGKDCCRAGLAMPSIAYKSPGEGAPGCMSFIVSTFSVVRNPPITPRFHAGLWHTLGQDQAGSMVARPGTLPVPLACLLDRFDSLKDLELSQNPWEHPPEAIVTSGKQAVRNFFEALFVGGTTAVTRPLKVVIVGRETVGKTSLRRSIKTGKPCMTREGVESTVHVDVEDHKVDGHPIRMFDCAGQVVYYGLLQLFLTPRAVHLLVWDASKASEMDGLNLEDLAIAPWLRYLTFRVPGANVVLVGNKWDRVAKTRRAVADDVERESRQWLKSWMEKAYGRKPLALSLEDGVSLVSCAPSGLGVLAPAFGGGSGWACDKSTPGLFHRIIYNPIGNTRAVSMCLPSSYQLALEMLEELTSSSRRNTEQRTRGITKAGLEEKWQAKVAELNRVGTPVAAPEAAMSGAISIRKWEGGLVEYGSYVFLDIEWFATVLDPLFSHKRDSNGDIDLGGIRVSNVASLRLLDEENIFEPRLAEELWGPELAPHLLLALNSAGLTFPLPQDPNGGLVILLRMGTKPPPEYRTKREEENQARKYDLRLTVACSFSLGVPPGFVERLLARCCHLGFPYPFWRYGALIVGNGAEDGLFSLSLQYSEKDKILRVEVFGADGEVHAWAALSKVLSVMIKMLSAEFRGLPCEPIFFCPQHETKGMPIRTTDVRPGSRLVEESYFCPLCQDRATGIDLLAVALQVVKFSDEEFFDAQLREQFAENAKKVARQGSPSPSGSISEFMQIDVPVENPSNSRGSLSHRANSTCHCFFCYHVAQGLRTPWYQDVKTWVGAASVACFTVFGVFAAKEDDDPRLWGVFLGVDMLLVGVEFVVISREYMLLCFKPRVEAARAGDE